MIKGVLFDMDGVLVDNMAVHARAFEIFAEQFGVENVKEKMYQYAGMGNDEIMPLLLPEQAIRERGVKELAAEKEALYREIYAADIKPIDGLIEFLEALKAKGIKCAVGSSGCKENVEFVLEKCNIGHYFEAKVYSDLVTRCKPDPEIYLTAAKLLGLKPSECLVVEDALVGIESARNAGAGKIFALTTTVERARLQKEVGIDQIADNYLSIINCEL